MTPEEFRRHGHALIDWISEYLETVESLPVTSAVEPGDVRRSLPEHPPAEREAFETILADLDRVVVPGLTHWQHPSFFAFFPGNSSYASVLGDLASAGLGVQGMSWVTRPRVHGDRDADARLDARAARTCRPGSTRRPSRAAA
jgi:aromatic-L-amino-acid decarboxylase